MIKVTAIYHFPNTFFPDFFRFLARQDWIDLRILFCYPTTKSGIVDKKTGEVTEWGADLLSGYKSVFMKHNYKTSPSDVLHLKNSEVKKLITKENTDIVLLASSYWAPTTWMAIRRAKSLHIPLITRATVEARRKRKWYVNFIRELLVKKYCKLMSSGIYECEDQKLYLISHGLSESKVFFAPCAVNNDFFQAAKKKINKDEERGKIGINKKHLVFLFVAGMNSRKRPMDLLIAFEKLKKEHENISVVFVGDGNEKDTLINYIKLNNIKDAFVIGFANREQIVRYYAMADVYVLPAENDASPKTLNEAMNFSLPIIITNGVGTSKELLNEGKNGFIYDAGDIKTLESLLKWFIVNKDCIEEMGKESLDIVSRNSFVELCEGWKRAINNTIVNK